MKLSIISAGLSAALIDTVGNKSVEVLMKMGNHEPLLLLPKGSYALSGSAADGRKLVTFKELTRRLRRDLAEQYFGTHDAFHVADIDFMPVQGRDAKVEVEASSSRGGCNEDWDWTAIEWMVTADDLGGKGSRLKHGELKASSHVTATLALHGATLKGHRPIEPVTKARQHKVGLREQRFTDAMLWTMEFAKKAQIKWTNRKDSAKTADLTFNTDTECLLLNLPAHPVRGSHLDAFKNLPFEPRLKFDPPAEKAECKYGSVMPADAHDADAPNRVRVIVEAPADAVASGVSISIGGRDGHTGEFESLGDSLCMRMFSDVPFD